MFTKISSWLFYGGSRYHIETSPLIFCSANQWTGFCMITASVMKELNYSEFFRSCKITEWFLSKVPIQFNPFVPNIPFHTPWKHQKTVRFSDVFRGVEKGYIGSEWINVQSMLVQACKIIRGLNHHSFGFLRVTGYSKKICRWSFARKISWSLILFCNSSKLLRASIFRHFYI